VLFAILLIDLSATGFEPKRFEQGGENWLPNLDWFSCLRNEVLRGRISAGIPENSPSHTDNLTAAPTVLNMPTVQSRRPYSAGILRDSTTYNYKAPASWSKMDRFAALKQEVYRRQAFYGGRQEKPGSAGSVRLAREYSGITERDRAIERSVIVSETQTFSVDESWLSAQPSPSEVNVQPRLFNRLPAQEKAVIEAALRECGGRVYGPSGAARKLGIARTTLESKIQALKINKNRFKPDPFKDS